MIFIKQRFIIISVTIFVTVLGLLTVYFNVGLTPDKKLEKIIEQQDEVETDFEELEALTEVDENDNEEDVTEQVRLYLSDTLAKTVQFFFTTELHVVGLGDSLTEGIGDPTTEGGYIGILDRMINKEDEPLVHFYNYGKRGSRTDQLLTRLEDDAIKRDIKQADIILISIGANDIMQVFKENLTRITLAPFTKEEVNYEMRLNTIFTELQALNGHAHIYLLGFYNPFGQYFDEIDELNMIVNNWNSIGEHVTEQHKNVTFIPIKDLFEKNTDTLLADDFFHPNYEGYRHMAERVLYYMTEEGDDHNEEQE